MDWPAFLRGDYWRPIAPNLVLVPPVSGLFLLNGDDALSNLLRAVSKPPLWCGRNCTGRYEVAGDNVPGFIGTLGAAN